MEISTPENALCLCQLVTVAPIRELERLFDYGAHSGYDVRCGWAFARRAGGVAVVDGRSRAYIEVLLLRAAWRATQDAEAQIAHWLLDGQAAHADLMEARDRSRHARQALSRARRVYTREANRAAVARQ